jgi:hypothetical protein
VKSVSLFVMALLFVACSGEPSYEIENWNALIDPAFEQEKVVAFYKEKVKAIKEGSQEEAAIYEQLQEALKDAGSNKAIDNKKVKLKGYIVPIDTQGERVNKFLFFPNQAACIHVPASPMNQTIYVTALEDKGVLMEDAYEQIIVYGTIRLQSAKVATGTASYVINDAVSELAAREEY